MSSQVYFFTGHSQARSTAPTAQDSPSCDGLQRDQDIQIQEQATSHDDREEIIQNMVSCNLPKPPADLPGNLPQYLLTVQETVRKDLRRLGPQLKNLGLMGPLVESYHHQIFDCFNHLLQNLNDLQSLFILVSWVFQTYLR